MYNPIQDGIAKTVKSVRYESVKPPEYLSQIVHNYWSLKTEQALKEDFHLHALPDGCVNILFNQKNIMIAGVTALHITYEALNLGRDFHYIGIQFFPGAWRGDLEDTSDRFVGEAYAGNLPLLKYNKMLAKQNFATQQPIFTELVAGLIEKGLASVNPITSKILAHIGDIHSVGDMAVLTGLSTRQLQRALKTTTGFTPHDFLKLLRLQQSFKQHYLDFYADQPHFIHSFRKITGYTPKEYFNKFDV